MDVNEELRKSEVTGKVLLGLNQTLDAVRSGDSKLIVLSSTCPEEAEDVIRDFVERSETPLYYFEGRSEELGLAFGKPFLVSAAAVIDPGDSSVLELGGNYK